MKKISKYVSSPYYKTLIRQFILFTEAMILYKYKVDYNQILNKLIKTIKISTPTFDLLNYELFIYSPMEIRILMNIALILNKMGYK